MRRADDRAGSGRVLRTTGYGKPLTLPRGSGGRRCSSCRAASQSPGSSSLTLDPHACTMVCLYCLSRSALAAANSASVSSPSCFMVASSRSLATSVYLRSYRGQRQVRSCAPEPQPSAGPGPLEVLKVANTVPDTGGCVKKSIEEDSRYRRRHRSGTGPVGSISA